MKPIKKRYTQLFLAGLIIGISISLLLNYKSYTRINQLEEVIELQERQIEVLNDAKNDYINRYEKLKSTLSYINEENAKWTALVNTTIILETGHKTSYTYNVLNNYGGISCGVEYCSYESKEQGLQALETLLEQYVDAFGYDIQAIRSVYCPISDEGCIGDYEKFIEIYNEQLEKELNKWDIKLMVGKRIKVNLKDI